jgi:hypothetical protein
VCLVLFIQKSIQTIIQIYKYFCCITCVGSRTPHRMFVVVLGKASASSSTGRIKTVAVMGGMKSGVVSTGRQSERLVLVAVT